MSFIKGQTYEWKDILGGLEAVAGPVFYLLHERGTQTVKAACLSIDVNPRAPYEIIPAIGQFISPWADNLCSQTEPIPVFVRELDGKYYYRGIFNVTGQSSDANEIRLRGQQCNRTDIYKIIFLAEAPTQP